MTTLDVRPIALREARRFVGEHHRHSAPPRGWLFGCALWHGEEIVGVGIAGRPNARMLQDGRTLEVTRCTVVDGYANACSRLYGRLCRAGAALGYVRAVSYTQGDEEGASLKAAGFVLAAAVDGEASWDRPSRRREDFNLLGETPRDLVPRRRWERAL